MAYRPDGEEVGFVPEKGRAAQVGFMASIVFAAMGGGVSI